MTTLDPRLYANTAAQGRECGSCTLCCKVYDVPSLAKPMGQWCRHCTPGKGCGIHETRPDHCRSFFCLWMTDSSMPDNWKPERSRFVLSVDARTRFLNVQVDPGAPNAWRAEPFLSQFKAWSRQLLAQERFVMIYVNRSATVVLPDRDVALGPIHDGDRLLPYRQLTPAGVTYSFEIARAAQ